MSTFAVIYNYGDDSAARDDYRPQHKDFLEAQYDAGKLLVSGPLTDTEKPGALLVISANSAQEAAALLDGDPFMQQGLIASREIRAWNIFFGALQDSREQH